MAKVIDARRMGGEIILLGKSVTLPYDSTSDEDGASPLIASLRYNPEADDIEAALLVGDEYVWCPIGVSRGDRTVAYTDGTTFTGPLSLRGSQILADKGIAVTPAISFAADKTLGLFIDSNGKFAAAAGGAGVLTIEADGLHVAQTASATTLVAPGVRVENYAVSTAYIADAHYDVGSVLVIGGNAEVTTTTMVGDVRKIGVVTSSSNDLSNIVYVAERGRAQCLVQGPVSKGDLIVTSNTAGYAQSAANTTISASAVVGRALQNFPSNTTGIITIKV